MIILNKIIFERDSKNGSPESIYVIAMLSCCNKTFVLDKKLNELYFDSRNPSFHINLLDRKRECPGCASRNFNIIEDFEIKPGSTLSWEKYL